MAISKIELVSNEEMKPVYEMEFNTPIKEIGMNIGTFFKELKKHGLTATGKLMCSYLEVPKEDKTAGLKHVLSIKVGSETYSTTEYPQHMSAMIKVTGSYKQLKEAYEELSKYVEGSEYEMIRPPYEVYVKPPKLGFIPIGLETEVHFPIRKKS